MTTTTTLLDTIQVAKPCPANWAEMSGDDRVRHCAMCKLDVYDLSAMPREEAETFVATRIGKERTCVRFFRRADGRMLTQDCPVGVRKAWKKMTWAAAALLAGGFAAAAMLAPRGYGGRPQVAPLKQIYDFIDAHFGPPPAPMVTQGDVCLPTPPSPPPASGGPAVPAPKPPEAVMGRVAAPDPIEVKGEMMAPRTK